MDQVNARPGVEARPVRRIPARRIKTAVSILVMVLVNPLGNVLLRKGMHQIVEPTAGSGATLMTSIAHVLGSGTIWLGITCLIAYVVAEMIVLSWADYSYVQPVAATAYGVAALLGHIWLGEDVSLLRWLGIGVIGLGVLLVGQTAPHTTGAMSA